MDKKKYIQTVTEQIRCKRALPLVTKELEGHIEDQKSDYMKAGMNVEEAEEAAEFRVKAGLTLAELSKALKVEATSDELASEINTYKTQYANNPEMAKRFDEPEVQREIANRLITEKTVDELVRLNRK